MKIGAALRRLIKLAPRKWLWLLMLFNLLGGMTEGVGIVMLVPLLDVIAGHSGGVMSRQVVTLMQALHLPLSPISIFSIFLLLIGLRAAVQYGREISGHHVRNHVIATLRQQVFSSVLYAEWRWLKSQRSAEHTNLLLNDINRVSVIITYGSSLLSGLTMVMASVGAAFYLSFWQSVTVCGIGGVFFLMMAKLRKQALLQGAQLTQSNRMLQSTVQDSFEGLKLIKIWGAQQQHLAYLSGIVEKVNRDQLDFSRSHGRSMMLFQVMAAVFLTLFLYASLNIWHTPLPVLLTLVTIFARFIPQFINLHQQLHHWLHAFPAWLELEKLIEQAHKNAETIGNEQALSLPAMNHSIRVENVSVVYANGKVRALDNVSVELQVGKTTVICGPSGAGKSTLLDVIAGLLIPDTGALYVDDARITALTRRAWQNQVAYVPQEVYLFHESIRENLLRAKRGASEGELLTALEMASALEFIQAQPQGIDTVVGDKGGRLSGGERQRIALARALLLKPTLLILDEATSALDSGNQLKINEVLKNLRNTMTILVVTHNHSAVSFADKIISIAHGCLTESSAANVLHGEGEFL